MTTYFQAFIR